MERLRVVEDHLLVLVVAVAVFGLVVPRAGSALVGAVGPLLALLMLCVSLTFDVRTLRRVLARPGIQLLVIVLVYGAMSVAAVLLASSLLGPGELWLGLVLVGVLPTDVSSPLLVWMARGNVALATVSNAVTTGLAPVLVPTLFVLYTGVVLDVPVLALVAELTLTVLVPTAVGVAVRTWRPAPVRRVEPALSATGAVAYLALLLAVVGPNADTVLAAPASVAAVTGAALALNLVGYGLAWSARALLPARDDRVALLFTVSKKEFSIAAVVVAGSGLPVEVALPAAVYAIVQMVTAPVAARLAARGAASARGPRRG